MEGVYARGDESDLGSKIVGSISWIGMHGYKAFLICDRYRDAWVGGEA